MRSSTMLVSSVHTKSQAEALRQPLADLAYAQMESPGFAPAALLRAVLAHANGGAIHTVDDGDALAAAIALKTRAWPLPIAESWITPITSSGLPILAQAHVRPALRALLDAQSRPVLLREVPVASKAYALLQDEATHMAVLARWERACLATTSSFEDWFAATFDHKRRKEFKRLRARLGEQGELVSARLAAGADPAPFIDNLLRLEAGGWKGQRGTAMSQDPAIAAALRQGLGEVHAQGALRFWQLTLDGKAIAALFAVVENGQATLGKIAYDELHAKYSPGVLTILDATASLFADPRVQFADSNAIPDHPMINRLWRERHAFEDVLVAGAGISAARFRATVAAERARMGVRRVAKEVYARVRRS
jgi:CelD/BcsL family acetyltransferase involved in cellulose biosynthesis